MRTTQVADRQAEREVFGADHAHVGSVAFHHHPADYTVTRFCAVAAVHVGNALAETEARMGHGTLELTGLDHAYIARESLPFRLTRWRELCAAG